MFAISQHDQKQIRLSDKACSFTQGQLRAGLEFSTRQLATLLAESCACEPTQINSLPVEMLDKPNLVCFGKSIPGMGHVASQANRAATLDYRIIFVPNFPGAFDIIQHSGNSRLIIHALCFPDARGEWKYIIGESLISSRFADTTTLGETFSSKIRAAGIKTLVTKEAEEICRDKLAVKDQLTNLVRMPSGIVIDEETNDVSQKVEEYLNRSHVSSLIIKPASSFQGIGVHVLDSHDSQVPIVIEKLRQEYGSVIVEERIQSLDLTGNNQHYVLRVLATPHGASDVLMRCSSHFITDASQTVSDFTVATLRDRYANQAMDKFSAIMMQLDQLSRIVCNQLGAGLLGLDCILDENHNGEVVLIEANCGLIGGVLGSVIVRKDKCNKEMGPYNLAVLLGLQVRSVRPQFECPYAIDLVIPQNDFSFKAVQDPHDIVRYLAIIDNIPSFSDREKAFNQLFANIKSGFFKQHDFYRCRTLQALMRSSALRCDSQIFNDFKAWVSEDNLQKYDPHFVYNLSFLAMQSSATVARAAVVWATSLSQEFLIIPSLNHALGRDLGGYITQIEDESLRGLFVQLLRKVNDARF